MPTVVTMPVSDLKPYEANPREIGRDAIDRVKASIETYGFQAPIIVDRDNVIIAGHTRYQALRELGITEARVIVSELHGEEADQYRIVDNRSSELAVWDNGLLIPELRNFANVAMLELMFPDIDLAEEGIELSDVVNEADLTLANDDLEARLVDSRELGTRVVSCPECGGPITVSG